MAGMIQPVAQLIFAIRSNLIIYLGVQDVTDHSLSPEFPPPMLFFSARSCSASVPRFEVLLSCSRSAPSDKILAQAIQIFYYL